MYLEEICQEIHCTLQTDVLVSVIGRLLTRYGIARKKSDNVQLKGVMLYVKLALASAIY